MLDRGSTLDWFNSPEICIEAIMAAIGLWVFVIQTMTAAHPFFHRDLAKDRNFVSTTLLSLCSGAMALAPIALLPSMMQNLMGYSALESGYASVSRGVGALVASVGSPVLVRFVGGRRALLCGFCISMLSVWQMSQFDLMMGSGPIVVAGFNQGLGAGLMYLAVVSLAFATLAPVHRAEAAVINNMARNLGASVGISLLQAGMVRRAAAAHAALAVHVQPSDPVFMGVNPAAMNPNDPVGVQILNDEVTRQAGMIAFNEVFAAMTIAVAFFLPLLLLMRSAPRSLGRPLHVAD
jgi:DHA2 family multidrug resistance protein